MGPAEANSTIGAGDGTVGANQMVGSRAPAGMLFTMPLAASATGEVVLPADEMSPRLAIRQAMGTAGEITADGTSTAAIGAGNMTITAYPSGVRRRPASGTGDPPGGVARQQPSRAHVPTMTIGGG